MELLGYTQVAAICAALGFMAFDVFCGTIRAAMQHTLSSKIAREGVMHKTALILSLMLGVALHVAQSLVDMGIHIPILLMICLYVVFTEVISVLENLGAMNPQLRTSKFMNMFSFAYDGTESDEEKRGEHARN